MNYHYVLRRLLQAVPTLAAILVVTFVLIHLAPGDPVRAFAGEGGDVEYYEEMRERFGLDRPMPVQFGTFIKNAFQGDLGVSYVYSQPAGRVILEFIPATLLLTVTAFALSTILGMGLGLISARRPGGRFDSASNLGSLVLHATPNFVLAQVALLIFALYAGIFPSYGMTDPRAPTAGLGHIVDVAYHLILPASVLALHDLALISRLTRTNVLRELGKDHIRVALGKGISQRSVLVRHALPGALLPLITVLGGRLNHLFAGAAVVEIVFAWPGMGRLVLTATGAHDYPVLLGIFLLVGVALVVTNLAVDLLYARVDPRVTYA